MSDWIKFFTAAGIPPGPAAKYAMTFMDNRIQKSMLMDLTKEYLKEMGVSVMGDVICILKYAKSAYSQVIICAQKCTVEVSWPSIQEHRVQTLVFLISRVCVLCNACKRTQCTYRKEKGLAPVFLAVAAIRAVAPCKPL